MRDDKRIFNLVFQWNANGRKESAEEVCRKHPSLLQRVARKMQDLRDMDFLDEPKEPADRNIEPPRASQDSGWKAGDEPVPGYHLVGPRRLGRGGYGEAWRAHSAQGVPVALKMVPPDDPNNPLESVCGVERRALDIIKHHRHEGLLPLFDYWTRDDGGLVICSQLANKTLRDRLIEAQDKEGRLIEAQDKEGRLGIPGDELRRYMRQIASALDFLRQQRIQHCDVKQSNIFLIGRRAYLGDFSLVRKLSRKAAPVSSRSCTRYAPPEFVDGNATPQSDQYMLAITYCELRGGCSPFPDHLAGLVLGEPDLSMLNRFEHPVVARALERKPSDRWPSCTAFMRNLDYHAPPDLDPCEKLERHLLNHIREDIQIAILQAMQSHGLTLREGITDQMISRLLQPRGNDPLAIQAAKAVSPEMPSSPPCSDSISREDVFLTRLRLRPTRHTLASGQ